jgi:hypothetical protein
MLLSEKKKEIKRLEKKHSALLNKLANVQSRYPKNLSDLPRHYLKCFNLALEANFYYTQIGFIQSEITTN